MTRILTRSLLGLVTGDGADNAVLLALDTVSSAFGVTLGLSFLDLGWI